MPGMDGLEFLQFLKEQDSKAHIVILSGSSEAYRRIAEDLGASHGLAIEANIPKPFRIGEMRAVLEKIEGSLHDEVNWKKHNA
jgi:CheY-like chemotaxis protein